MNQNRAHPERPPCLRPAKEGCTLTVRVQPRAKRSEICGVRNGCLRVRLNAPPVDGKANDELVRLLRKRLGLAKSAIAFVSGETSREKVLLLRNQIADVSRRLAGEPA